MPFYLAVPDAHWFDRRRGCPRCLGSSWGCRTGRGRRRPPRGSRRWTRPRAWSGWPPLPTECSKTGWQFNRLSKYTKKNISKIILDFLIMPVEKRVKIVPKNSQNFLQNSISRVFSTYNLSPKKSFNIFLLLNRLPGPKRVRPRPPGSSSWPRRSTKRLGWHPTASRRCRSGWRCSVGLPYMTYAQSGRGVRT